MRDDFLYKKGFSYAFDPKACLLCGGACCIGERGNIFLNSEELLNIANFLKLPLKEVKKTYTKKIEARLSLKEFAYKDGFSCIFFDTMLKSCKIYEQRPAQCRSFPFWDYYKDKKEELLAECIGVYF